MNTAINSDLFATAIFGLSSRAKLNIETIQNMKGGAIGCLAYLSNVKEIKGMSKVQRIQFKTGDYENFKQVKEVRAEGVTRSTRKSNEVQISNNLLYNTSTKLIKFKVNVLKTLEKTYFLNGKDIENELAEEMIKNARKPSSFSRPVLEWRTFDVNNILYIA